MTAVAGFRGSRAGRGALGYAGSVLVAALGAASVAVVVATRVPTTHAAASSGATVLELAAGLGAMGAGTAWWVRGRTPLVGLLTLLLGATWLAADWVGWIGGVPVARSLAMVLAPFHLAVVLHLVLAYPTGHLGPGARRVLRAAYGVTALYSGFRALVRDPFLDPGCWDNCTDNVFLLAARPALAGALDLGWVAAGAAAGAGISVVAVGRLVRAGGVGRRRLSPVLLACAVAAGAWSVQAGLVLAGSSGGPGDGASHLLHLVRGTALASIAAALCWSLARDARTARRLARLTADLAGAPRPGDLRSALATALGDPGARLAYWLPGAGRYVDEQGRPVDVGAGGSRAATSIVRRGEPVAIVLHDRTPHDERDLSEHIGTATRVAVDNERLRAAVLAQVHDLRASQVRIVEAADVARRRLEHDLHDGAQQGLLAVSFELQRARAAAGSPIASAALASACVQASEALDALRALAHGIYPAVLLQSGLGAALRSVGDGARIPVEVRGDLQSRHGAAEHALYVLVAEAVERAADDGAEQVTVTLDRAGDTLRVQVAPVCSSSSTSTSTSTTDRIGAVGGSIRWDGRTMTAEAPCA